MTKETFFTSDQHFDHENIIRYCNRPFSSVEEMNEVMTERHNKTVRPSDTVFIIGDFSFHNTPTSIVKRYKSLNGNKIWVTGNHDVNNYDILQFHRILELKGKKWGGYDPTLCHYPMLSWNKSFHGSFQLHGHMHGTLPFDPKVRRLDVGVDTNNFTPVHWDDIVAKLSKIPTPKELELIRQEGENLGTT